MWFSLPLMVANMAHHGGAQSSEDKCATISENAAQVDEVFEIYSDVWNFVFSQKARLNSLLTAAVATIHFSPIHRFLRPGKTTHIHRWSYQQQFLCKGTVLLETFLFWLSLKACRTALPPGWSLPLSRQALGTPGFPCPPLQDLLQSCPRKASQAGGF